MSLFLPHERDKNRDFTIEMLSVISENTETYFFVWNLASDECYVTPSLMDRFEVDGTYIQAMSKVVNAVVYPTDLPLIRKYVADVDKEARSSFSLECRLIERYGKKNWVNLRCQALRDEQGKATHVIGSITDVDSDSRADPLTGLLNHAQMAADFSRGFGPEQNGYVMVLGIDDFKAVNDRHGRKFGNQLLQLFAATLEKCVAGGGRVYRLESDRFSAVLEDKNRAAVSKLYVNVKSEFQEQSRQLKEGVFCTVSGGAAAFPYDSRDLGQLLQFSDSALNTAKRTGKDALVFFLREDYEQYLVNISMREDIQRSLKNGFEGFELYYQPQISMHSGQVEGAEALLRWNSREHGRIPPVVFIPLLEKYGLICQVGRWVIETALEQCRHWRQRIPDFCMSINLSYIQLEKDDIAGFVLSCLRRFELPGDAVLLELTESEQLHNYHYYNETLSYLNRIGVMVAIDDFGTGYSSLGYFKELHINQIKIDRCFVTRIRESEYDFKLIQFIIELAHGIGVSVCVEGVETAEELEALLPLRPDYIQGFYFGRPEPSPVFEQQFLDRWDKNMVHRLEKRAMERPAAAKAPAPPVAQPMPSESKPPQSEQQEDVGHEVLAELEIHKIVVDCARALLGEESLDGAIIAVLDSIGQYHKADRAYIMEMDEEGTGSNTYEWCLPDVTSKMELWQAMDWQQQMPHFLQRLQDGKPVVVQGPETLNADWTAEFEMMKRNGLTHWILEPLFTKGNFTGFVAVDNPRHETDNTLLLNTLAYFITNEIAKRKLSDALYKMSYRDSLTAVLNRNRYLEDIRSDKVGQLASLGVLYADINALKELNDSRGHEFGDELIRQVADDLLRGFYGYDVYRIGGDEFVVLCPNISEKELDRLVNRLRETIDRRSYSVSIGYTWEKGKIDPNKLTRQADLKMYSNKNEYYREEQQQRQRREYAREKADATPKTAARAKGSGEVEKEK